jgi:hypothetical protein
MSPLKHILAIATVFSCLFSSISSIALSSISSSTSSKSTSQSSQTSSVSSTISSQQIELADKLPNGKKQLKKPLSLDYTNPKFETEITQSQREAILKALKKWKGELPVNNTFTITSWADLKTETADGAKQSKKKDKKTENAQVIYMWASTPNTKWDNSKLFDAEDYESGDPRFIRTEFNVLLKQSKKGDWKASLERDTEVKTDSESITESPEDQKVYQDLFGTDKADNLLTATSDILVGSISLASSTSSSLTSISTIITSSSVISSNISNNSSTIANSSQAQSNSNTSSKKVGFLESLLNLGSVKASAGENDNSWPWKAGETWNVNTGYGWHECSTPSETNYAYSEGITVSGCAFDMSPNSSAGTDILAPKSGNIRRSCKDDSQGFVRIGEMSILHINQSGIISDNVTVNKSQKIGNLFYPTNYNLPGNGFKSRCGTLYGAHLHIKFAVNNMVVDGTTIVHNGTLPSTLTSQNTTNTTQNVLFRDVNSGNNSIWKFSNTSHTGDTAFPNNVGPEWKVAGFGDFNADGYQDILWRNSNNGQNVLWEMQNGVISKDWGIISTVGLDFSVAGIGDFNGDGYADILWRNNNGNNVIWNYQRNVKTGDSGNFSYVPTDWKVVSVADFSGDGKADIFWRNNNGSNVLWNMNNWSTIPTSNDGLEFVDNTWYVAGVADFNNDQKKDIFWRNNNGSNVIWNMNNRVKNASLSFSSVGNDFIVGGLGDFNQDGKADIFWRSITGGQNVIWNMNNATINANTQVGATGASNTQVKGIFAK